MDNAKIYITLKNGDIKNISVLKDGNNYIFNKIKQVANLDNENVYEVSYTETIDSVDSV